MANKEVWGETPDVILNGEPVRGRSKQNEDGSFRALDLVELGEMTTLRVEAVSGDIHHFVKAREQDDDGVEIGAMDGWVRRDAEAKLGGDIAGRFVFLEPNPKGASFLTHGVVMRHGLELGFVSSEQPPTNVIQNLGVIARIHSGVSHAETFEEIVSRLKSEPLSSV